MKELIKQVLRESTLVTINHDIGEYETDDIDKINMLNFQRWRSMGLLAYVLLTDKDYISSFNLVTSPSELKTYKNRAKNDRLLLYVIDEPLSVKITKVIDNTNEIIRLKKESIKLFNQHMKSVIGELLKQTP
jgi:hypothetical protein